LLPLLFHPSSQYVSLTWAPSVPSLPYTKFKGQSRYLLVPLQAGRLDSYILFSLQNDLQKVRPNWVSVYVIINRIYLLEAPWLEISIHVKNSSWYNIREGNCLPILGHQSNESQHHSWWQWTDNRDFPVHIELHTWPTIL
jgi:hypothetical protein